jgi:hypothetical protein
LVDSEIDARKFAPRRSIGRIDEVVAQVLDNPSLFAVVFDGTLCNDPHARICCVDAVERISTTHPQYLQPFKKS